jgi:hypothetical protein
MHQKERERMKLPEMNWKLNISSGTSNCEIRGCRLIKFQGLETMRVIVMKVSTEALEIISFNSLIYFCITFYNSTSLGIYFFSPKTE